MFVSDNNPSYFLEHTDAKGNAIEFRADVVAVTFEFCLTFDVIEELCS